MKVIRPNDPDYEEQIRELTAPSSLFDPTIEDRAQGIIDEVQRRGDDALLEFTQRFDGAQLTANQLAVGKAELNKANRRVGRSLRSVIAAAQKNIEAFSRKSLRKSWSVRNAQGAKVGEKFDPFQRVGIYIPGGTAPLVSTVLMTVTLARVARCPEIVVCTPCGQQGEVNDALLYAAQTAGATEIYRVGGAQAVAAMALGTRSIQRVQKVFGPGNAYVVAAKRLLFGHVAVDLLPGPSEVLILADESARPDFIAADLLAQAEHGSGLERVWLLTASGRLVKDVQQEIERQLPSLSRQDYISRALDRQCRLIQVPSMTAGIELANRLAPEHCEIMVRQAAKVAQKLKTAGAIFVGPYSPTVLGDYLAGPSHVLPTGGAGASFAGLTVDQFQRRTSLVEYSQAALKNSLPYVQAIAQLEGLEAHGISAEIRTRGQSGKRSPTRRMKR